jgi:hypothetical protein
LGTLLTSPQGLSPSIPLPPTPSQSNHKRFLFCLSQEDMKSIHHNPSPWSPSFTLCPPRSSPLSPATHTQKLTNTHTQTHRPPFIVASFLIPCYVDTSRCFYSCSHCRSYFIWSLQFLPLLPSIPSIAPPFPFLLSSPHFSTTLKYKNFPA